MALSVLACATGDSSVTETPELVSSGTSQGRGYPFGTTDSGDFTALTDSAEDPAYAYTQAMPVRLGPPEGGSRRSKLYLNGLRGPQGQVITFERRGACCPFETPASDFGAGLIDVYELHYEGLAEPLVVYINMYDTGEVLIPQGLTARGN